MSETSARPAPWSRTTAVVVTYCSEAVIGTCLAGLARARKVVVVDNAGGDGTVVAARAALPAAEIQANARNVGFGAGVNQGLKDAETEYGLVMAPDAVFEDGALERLVAVADAYPSAALIAPMLNDAGGGLEFSLMGPWEHNHHRVDTLPDGPFCTWFVTGAVFLCRMSAWRDIGGFDEAIFLYNEDADLSLRVTKAGWAMVVAPDARAVHLGGKGVAPTWRNRWRRDWHMTWSDLYLEGRHGSRDIAHSRARAIIRRHGLKALFYGIVLNPKRMLGNLAKARAARAWLRSAG